ncbi:MAG: hypothetical protein DRH43_02325 [Deltaproteobacteria bacterium]|nr:MAG: hypothetical protein DRH43_02325 [Deltaproteobacteria bacterium]
MNDDLLIELRNVGFSYSDTARGVLYKCNFTLGRSDRIALYGPNGCGKSTFLYLLAGLLHPSKGKRVVSSSSQIQTAFVFQDYSRSLLNWYSVEENLKLALQSLGDPLDVKEALSNVVGEAPPDWATAALQKYPYQLSGGQRQLICLLRALISCPSALFLDEPLSSLDVSHKRLAVQFLCRAAVERDAAWVIVAHDLDDCFLTADRILVVDGPPLVFRRWVDVPLGWPRDYQALSSKKVQMAREHVYEVLWQCNTNV